MPPLVVVLVVLVVMVVGGLLAFFQMEATNKLKAAPMATPLALTIAKNEMMDKMKVSAARP